MQLTEPHRCQPATGRPPPPAGRTTAGPGADGPDRSPGVSARRAGGRTVLQGGPRKRTAGPLLRALAGVGLIWALGTPGAAGAAADVYTVGGIRVDESGVDGSAARAAALQAGERAAFMRLLQWMLLEGDVGRVPGEVQADPAPFVTGYSVQNERFSADRYQATLEVQFDPEPVRALLGDLGLAFEEQRPAAHVLIPVWAGSGTPALWDNNPWLDVWARRPPGTDFIPLLVPHGELGDVSVLSAAAAVAGEAGSIAGLARRYGVTRALVVRADPAPGGGRVAVSVQLTDRGQPLGAPLPLHLQAAVDETPADLLRRAAMTAARAAGDLWIQWRRERRQVAGTLAVRAEFGSFGEWRRLLAHLRSPGPVAAVTVRRLATRYSELALAYSGSPEAVRTTLTAAGLAVDTAVVPWRVRFPPPAEPLPAPVPAARPQLRPDPVID